MKDIKKNSKVQAGKTQAKTSTKKGNVKMNKNDFVDMVTNNYKTASPDSPLTKKQITQVLLSTKTCLIENLKKGVDTTFTRFGSFVSYVRDKREAKNPNTGKPTIIPSKRVPKVKFHKSFKDLIS